MSPRFEDPLERIRQAASRSDGELDRSRTRFTSKVVESTGSLEEGSGEVEDALLPAVLEEDRMLAGLSYLLWFLVPPIILFTQKKNEPYVRFHALQGLFLGIGFTAISGVLLLFAWLFSLILAHSNSLSGAAAYVIIVAILALIYCVLIGLVVFYSYRAHTGTCFRLPLLASLADRYTPANFLEY